MAAAKSRWQEETEQLQTGAGKTQQIGGGQATTAWPPQSPPASLRCRAFSRRRMSCATLKMPPVGCSHTKHLPLLALCCSAHCSQK